MNIQIDRFGKIQTEDTHDGFCIDDISSGNQIKIEIIFGNIVYKCFTLSMELSEILTVFMITSSRKFRLFFGRAGGKSVNNSSWQHIQLNYLTVLDGKSQGESIQRFKENERIIWQKRKKVDNERKSCTA